MFLVVAIVVVSSYLGKKIHRSHNDEANQLRLWPGFLEEDNELGFLAGEHRKVISSTRPDFKSTGLFYTLGIFNIYKCLRRNLEAYLMAKDHTQRPILLRSYLHIYKPQF